MKTNRLRQKAGFILLFVLTSSLAPAQLFDVSLTDSLRSTQFDDIASRSDGKLIMLAGSRPGNVYDVSTIAAFHPNGTMAWKRTYPCGFMEQFDFAKLNVSTDGRINIAGQALTIGQNNDLVLVKTDTAANLLWAKKYIGQFSDYAGNFRITSDGGFIASGTAFDPNVTGTGFVLYKTDSLGNLQWSNKYGREFSVKIQCHDVLEDLNGDYYACGHFSDSAVVMKVSHTGAFLWMKNLSFPGYVHAMAYSLSRSHNSSAIMCSGTTHAGVFLVELDTTGTLNWCRHYKHANPPLIIDSYEMILSPDSGYAIAGRVITTTLNSYGGLLLRMGNTGTLLSAYRFSTAYGGPLLAIDTLQAFWGYGLAGTHFNVSNKLHGYGVSTDLYGRLYCNEQIVPVLTDTLTFKPPLWPVVVTPYLTEQADQFFTQVYTYNDSIPCVSIGTGDLNPSDNFSVFPVPAAGEISIRFPETNDWSIRLYDLCGRLVYDGSVTGTSQTVIRPDQVAAGIYVLQIKNGDHAFQKKILFSEAGRH